MATFSFLPSFLRRRGLRLSLGDASRLPGDFASGFEDTADLPAHFSRRQSDVRRLRRERSTGQKWLIILLLVGAYVLGAAVFHVLGYVQTGTLVALGALCVCIPGAFWLAFRTDWNRKFQEKRLKLPIVASCLAGMLLLVYLDPALQILLAPFTFVALAYGMYRISRNAAFGLALAELVGYAVVIALHHLEQRNSALLQLEILHFTAMVLALPGFVFLTGKVPLLHRVLNKASRKLRTIQADAQRDPLLGCYNRRYIVAALEEQRQLADETGIPLCIALLDLDHFKRINDEMGHLGGDEVLRNFARVAQQSVRDEDIFGRYGGEEFLLIFPATSLLPALNTCERLRAQVEAYPWGHSMRSRVTVSIGVTQYVGGESVLEFFSRADTATYLAKEGGRNQVVVEEPVHRGEHHAQDVDVHQEDDEETAILLAEEAGLVGAGRSASAVQ